eukprot:GHVH01005072.1.p1 GENE.GHVH01005072.1~~GHVH01005072.1.p1  ORF type:complete len:558 (-),score=95.49 GHVH01005072.1:45-1718(-)
MTDNNDIVHRDLTYQATKNDVRVSTAIPVPNANSDVQVLDHNPSGYPQHDSAKFVTNFEVPNVIPASSTETQPGFFIKATIRPRDNKRPLNRLRPSASVSLTAPQEASYTVPPETIVKKSTIHILPEDRMDSTFYIDKSSGLAMHQVDTTAEFVSQLEKNKKLEQKQVEEDNKYMADRYWRKIRPGADADALINRAIEVASSGGSIVSHGDASSSSSHVKSLMASVTSNPLVSWACCNCTNVIEEEIFFEETETVAPDPEINIWSDISRKIPYVYTHEGACIGEGGPDAVRLADGSTYVPESSVEQNDEMRYDDLTNIFTFNTPKRVRQVDVVAEHMALNSEGATVVALKEMKTKGDLKKPSVYNWIAPMDASTKEFKSDNGNYNFYEKQAGMDMAQSSLDNFFQPEVVESSDSFHFEDSDEKEVVKDSKAEIPQPSVIYAGAEYEPPQYSGRLDPQQWSLHAIEVHQLLDLSSVYENTGKSIPEEARLPWFEKEHLDPHTQAIYGPIPIPFDPSMTGLPAPILGGDYPHISKALRDQFNPLLPTAPNPVAIEKEVA